MSRKPGVVGADTNKPTVDAGTNARTQSLAPGSAGSFTLSVWVPLGRIECLTQAPDGSLWYYELTLFGTSQKTLASDRLNPSPGGADFKVATCEVLKKLPLDEYEKQIYEQVTKQAQTAARLKKALASLPQSGRIEQSNIIFDIIFFIVTWGGSGVASKLISTASFTHNIFSGSSDGPEGKIKDKGIETVFRVLLCNKFVNLKSDWVVELLTEVTSKNTSFKFSPLGTPDVEEDEDSLERKLRLVLAFKHMADKPKFEEQYAEVLKKIAEGKAKLPGQK